MLEVRRPTDRTWDAYLDWEARQPIRYELVDGQIYAMGGGTAEHDTIGNNLRGCTACADARQAVPGPRARFESARRTGRPLSRCVG